MTDDFVELGNLLLKGEISANEFCKQWISCRSLAVRNLYEKKQLFRRIFPLFLLVRILSRFSKLKSVTRALLIFENRLFMKMIYRNDNDYLIDKFINDIHSDCSEYVMGNYHDDSFINDVKEKIMRLSRISDIAFE